MQQLRQHLTRLQPLRHDASNHGSNEKYSNEEEETNQFHRNHSPTFNRS